MNRNALQRGDDVLPGERTGLAHRLDRAIQQEGGIRQFASAFSRVDEQCADAAVDIDEVVRARRPGLERQFVELVLPLGEILRQLFSKSAR
jgi:imidazoleglycerol phosphate dehydratase HisB